MEAAGTGACSCSAAVPGRNNSSAQTVSVNGHRVIHKAVISANHGFFIFLSFLSRIQANSESICIFNPFLYFNYIRIITGTILFCRLYRKPEHLILLSRNTVFRINRRAPTVITAHTAHCRVDTYIGVLRGCKLIPVRCKFELFRCIGKDAGLEGCLICRKPQTVTVFVLHGQPAAAHMVSTLLRHKVGGNIILRSRCINP